MRFVFKGARAAAFPLFCAAAIFYFAFYALQGAYGYWTLVETRQSLEYAKAELADLEALKAKLERRADLLSSQNVDPDLLDERARALLGFAREGEWIVPRSELAEPLE